MDIEKRKIIVGISGIDARDERLIEIVFRHSQYNPVEFELQQDLDLKGCEILLVNPMTPEGLKALARLRTSTQELPVVSVVPRGASPGSRYAIALDRLTLQLLPMLNRVVAEQCGPDGFESRGDLIVSRAAPHPPAPPHRDPIKLDFPVASTEAAVDPAAPVNDSTSPAAVAVAGHSDLPALGLNVAHVLIVDESLSARQQLSRAVESLGLLCSTVASAEEALALCQMRRFDMVFVEIVLPGVNGFRLTRELRQRFPQTPVVILSCKASPLDLLRGAWAGSSKYLAKPVKMFWFRKALEEGLRKSLLARRSEDERSGENNGAALTPGNDRALPVAVPEADAADRSLATPV